MARVAAGPGASVSIWERACSTPGAVGSRALSRFLWHPFTPRVIPLKVSQQTLSCDPRSRGPPSSPSLPAGSRGSRQRPTRLAAFPAAGRGANCLCPHRKPLPFSEVPLF